MMIENDFLGEELIIDHVILPKTVKGFVDMKRQTEERWKTKLNEDPFYEDQPLNELTNDVLEALEKGTKPERKAPDFNRYDAGDKNKDLKEVMNIEDRKN